MERVRFIRHNHKEILFLDFSECKAAGVFPLMEKAKAVIASQAERSLLTFTDVTNMRFDDTLNQRMKEFTAQNKPFVKAAAAVGVTGITKILFEAIMLFSKRKLHAFETIEQAKAWLSAQ